MLHTQRTRTKSEVRRCVGDPVSGGTADRCLPEAWRRPRRRPCPARSTTNLDGSGYSIRPCIPLSLSLTTHPTLSVHLIIIKMFAARRVVGTFQRRAFSATVRDVCTMPARLPARTHCMRTLQLDAIASEACRRVTKLARDSQVESK